MEFQGVELTVEDILNLHQGWITELYIHERRTDVEIVDLLQRRQVPVTLAQVQSSIREWNLVLPDNEPSAPSPSPTLSDDSGLISSPPEDEPPPLGPYTPSDPAQISKYNEKPLPSLPLHKSQKNSSKIQKKKPSKTNDRLKLTCHHGPELSDVHEIQTPLDSIPDGTSMIDRYTEDEQAYEQLALGVSRKRYRRAIDSLLTNPGRTVRMSRVRKRTSAKNEGRNGSNGNRSPDKKSEPEPEPDEDVPEWQERRKTPPSPCDET